MMMPWLTRSVLVVAALVLATCFIDTDWEVSHQVVIEANSAEVWEVLVNLERYPQWNRYSPNVTGKVAVGEVVWVEAHLDNEVQRVENIVTAVKPEQELCWQSADWYGFLARGTRCRWLSTTPSGDTLLIHHEVMSGPLAWLIEWLYRQRIEQGLKLVDDSLKARVEALSAD
jgi:uncharacterized membrane protein